MRILVTGAAGFVGRHVTAHLTARGHSVVRVDLLEGDIVGSIADPMLSRTELSRLDFDAIVHLAAIADIKQTLANMYACYAVNAYGTLNLLELAVEKQGATFVFASSANVYGAPKHNPVKETAPFQPRAPYDYSKVIAEHLVNSYHQHRGLRTVILRSWKMFGEYERATAAIPRFIHACLRGEPIPLYNSGRDSTAPYHAANYAHAVELCLTRPEAVGEAFNIGGLKEMNFRQIAELVRELTKTKVPLQDLPPRTPLEAEPQRSVPDTGRIRNRLGYRETVSLSEGLERTINWYRAQARLP